MKAVKWFGVTLSALVLVLAAFIVWIIYTPAGVRWAAGVATNVLGAKLDIGAIRGQLVGPIELYDVHYLDPGDGVDLYADRVRLDVAMSPLFRRTLRLNEASLQGVRVVLTEPQPKESPPQDKAPFTLEPPIDIVIRRFLAEDVRIRRADVTLFELTRGEFIGRWTHEGVSVERFEMQSPQGSASFTGQLAGRDGYQGEGQGRFQWRVGELNYAGRLQTHANGADAHVALNLSAPVRAKLDLLLEQTTAWAWRFSLDAPRFDPRESLAPDSGIESLAASLRGEGTMQAGSLHGELRIDGETLHLDPVRFTRGQDTVGVDARLRINDGAGVLDARADLQLAQEPWIADVQARWGELIIPAKWAGQVLHTRGALAAHGNTATFHANGELAIGPPERVAYIALKVDGTPKTIELSQFDIVQEDGRLAARGRIDLKPRIGWTLTADGRGFDPGAFAAGWRGDLNFALASQGRLTPDGPSATLRLDDLTGTLRGRPVTGHADLQLTPALVPSGELALASGKSTLQFAGAPGDAIDAVTSFDVASLNDWLPNAGGNLNGKVQVRGRWPEVAIVGDARGARLHAATLRVERFNLDAHVDDPKNAEGALRLDATQLAAGGFEFTTFTARAGGTQKDHQLEVRATGEPLGVQLALQGGRTQSGWTGAVNALVLDIKDAARLSLREPARIEAAEGGYELSQLCLADAAIELCASGATEADGQLQARYSLANVPLALGNALAPAELPLILDGQINGRGEIRRTTQGELFGDASITSREGRISRRAGESTDEDAAEPQLLLAYTDLNLAATLSGPQARARARASFTGDGRLEGDASVRGLGEVESPIQARVDARVPDLTPFGILVPQLANLKGRADARVQVAGTLQEPQINGEVAASDVAADVPALGLHLKNGRLEAQPAEGGAIQLTGGIQSGEGHLAFNGVANPSGAVEVNINGDRFLAADIPGARALVTPDLRFTRAEERLELAGKVTIPEAQVDLQKLPRGERAQAASSDVVVIDATTRVEEAQQTPLYANVTVVIGDRVELSGFGLQARVDGRIDVSERPGEPTTGAGQVRVQGAYKAYGQDLTIQEGQLLYASTPLDNPNLNFEATRQVEEVTAGLRVRGSAQNPELTVFSDPPMAQANALSYLVAGKPLDEIGADDEAEGDAMQTAARSLGTAAGGLLAKSVGRRLGVDKLAIQDEEAIGGAALTVGQYLSPRLYLSYGVGLFEPGEVATLRYKLSREVHVQAQRGPEDTRAGVEYRVER